MFNPLETDQRLLVFGIMKSNVSGFFKTNASRTTSEGESAKLAERLVKIHGSQDEAVRYWEDVKAKLIRQF